jgi:hypothetical protein
MVSSYAVVTAQCLGEVFGEAELVVMVRAAAQTMITPDV